MAAFIKGQRVILEAAGRVRRGIVERLRGQVVMVRWDSYKAPTLAYAPSDLQDEGDFAAEQQRKAEEAAKKAREWEDSSPETAEADAFVGGDYVVCQGCGKSDCIVTADEDEYMQGWCQRCQNWSSGPVAPNAASEPPTCGLAEPAEMYLLDCLLRAAVDAARRQDTKGSATMARKPQPYTATFDTYIPQPGDRVVITLDFAFDQRTKGATAIVLSVAPARSNCFARFESPEFADWPGPVGNGTVRVFPGEIAKVG